MKLLFVTGMAPLLYDRSKGVAVVNRIDELTRKGLDFDVVCPVNIVSSDILGRISSRFARYPKSWTTATGKDITFVRYFFAPRTVPISKIVMKYLKNDVYDAVLTHWGPTGWGTSLAAEKLQIPHIQYFHGSDVHTLANRTAYAKRQTISLINRSSSCFFVSRDLMNEAQKICGNDSKLENKSKITPNGIDGNVFRVMCEREISRHRKLIPSSGVTIGFVGNLRRIKGVMNIPIILSKLKEISSVKDFSFLIVGDGPLRGFLEKALADLKIKYYITGFIDQVDVAAYMNIMDVMILPSYKEGWPCVILEALACGTPVVATKTGGVCEALGKEENGFAIEMCDNYIERFALAIEKSIHLECTECMVNYARKFQWQFLVEKEVEYLQALI